MSTIYTNTQNFNSSSGATEGGTIVVTNSDASNIAIINATGTLNVLGATMPSSPHAGQQITFASSYAIAAFTPSGGSTTLPTVALQALGYVSFVYDGANTCWMEIALNGIPTGSTLSSQAYLNGTKYTAVFPFFASAVVSGGTATFYMTDNGLSTGNAVFKNNVFTQSINLITSDASNQYNYSGFTVASGNKSISITVNKVALSLGIIVFTAAANGTTIYLQISGN